MRPRFLTRWRHDEEAPERVEEVVVPVSIGRAQLEELQTVFAAPRWLKDIGRTSWFIVGLFLLLAGLVWLVGATYTITGPVLAAMIVGTVAMPIVRALARHMHRAAAAALVLVGLVAIGVVILLLVIGGITGQKAEISQQTSGAADKIQSWIQSLGVSESGAASANATVKSSVPDMIDTLLKGVVHGIGGLVSLAFGLSFFALSLFFLLKDGPQMRTWLDGHLGVPRNVAQTITGGVIRSLRGYFKGVTLVAAFNAVVVFIGALILDVPLAGTIAIVTFITAYVPYIGAFVAGAFAVLIALGAQGTTTAVIMLIIVLLANGLLQNIVQPFAMGAALQLNPLVVLVATIGAGCIFGGLGLVLAAPLLSAAVHITAELGDARARAKLETEGSAASVSVPVPGTPASGTAPPAP